MRTGPRRRVAVLTAVALAMTGATAGLSVARAAASGPSGPTLTTLDGQLLMAHGDTFNGAPMGMSNELKTKSGLVPLHVPAARHATFARLSGRQVHVRGTRVAGAFAASTVAADPTAAAPHATAAAAATRRIAVVLLHTKGSTAEPITPATAQGMFFNASGSVAAWYGANSDGATTVTGRVYGWYNNTYDPGNCADIGAALSGFQNEAAKQAAVDGYVASNYDNIVVYTPSMSCGFAGVAWVGASGVLLNGAASVGIAVHELGHNLGLWHAGSLLCGAVSIATSCSRSDYGDPFDPMGGASGAEAYNGMHKYQLGWLPSSEVKSVTSGTQTIDLTASETSVPGSTELIFLPGPSGFRYVVERRQPFGVYDTSGAGVWVRLAGYVGTDDTQLLDMTPGKGGVYDGNLAAGQTFTDSVSGVTIKTLSDSGPTASVQVCVGTCGGGPTTTTTSSTTTTTTKPTTTTTSSTTTTTTTTVPPGDTSARNIATAQRSVAGNASISLTVPAPGVAASHTVIAAAYAGGFNGAVGCSDSRGNVYSVDANVLGGRRLFVCSATVTTALKAGDTITLTYPGFSGAAVATANDFTGIRTSGRVDRSHAASGNSAVPSSGATAVTAQARELVFGVEAHASTPVFTAGAGYTLVGPAVFGTGSGRQSLSPEFRWVNATGAYSAGGSMSAGQFWNAAVVTYVLN